ncbi:hypothetical protein GF312_19485 [Candidatus Poribacteria bacterium]|nr:hypothetical protein [Candidatus Poribacteria bacterium]
MNYERNNIQEIQGLSQRGKTLSIVDLIKANTISVDMAAYSMYNIAKEASFLTAARPGNAGKTTLLACLLTFLPPGNQIITTSDPSVITNAEKYIENKEPDKICFLCHEIGSGPWYGYLWGRYVGQMINLINKGCRVATCIHADTLTELHDIMVSRELEVSEEDFTLIDLILFMNLDRSITGLRRRVSALYKKTSDQDRHKLIFSWDKSSDEFIKHDKCPEKTDGIDICRDFVNHLVKSGENDFRWVREKVLEFYDNLDSSLFLHGDKN